MSYSAQRRPDQSVHDRQPSAEQLSSPRARSPRASAPERTIDALSRLAHQTGGSAFCLVQPNGIAIDFGNGEPAFTLRTHNVSGLDALASLDALTIAHAYMDGDLDIEGDLLAALSYQERLGDFHPAIYLWRRVKPILLGRPRVNPAWIALHYDAQNAQLHAAESTWHTYTPGVYSSDDEALESGADRKLTLAFEALRLERGQRLLEVGCGWGGMLRYSAKRGVQVTGLTLSRLQKEFVEQRIVEEQLPAEVHYQDFFTFRPIERFDAVSMMGVIEDLSDYRTVMRLLSHWLKPGGRRLPRFRRRAQAVRYPQLCHQTHLAGHLPHGVHAGVYGGGARVPLRVDASRQRSAQLLPLGSLHVRTVDAQPPAGRGGAWRQVVEDFPPPVCGGGGYDGPALPFRHRLPGLAGATGRQRWRVPHH